ncbi:MAG: NADH-quinone oxidoreductase subunit N [Candidatus Melainabacteria bacterium]
MKRLLTPLMTLLGLMLPMGYCQDFSANPLGMFVEQHRLYLLGPETIIATALLFGLAHIMFEKKPENREQTWSYAVIGCVIALLCLVMQGAMIYADGPVNYSVFYNMFQADFFSLLMRSLLVLGTMAVLLMSRTYIRKRTTVCGEFYVVMLAALLGGMLATGAMDLIMLFVSLETLSISSYIMVGYLRDDRLSAEAALKYLVYGGVATASLLFGLSLLYGLTGSTNYTEIVRVIHTVNPSFMILAVMAVTILAGFGFKLSAAPFHMWTPDVYHGAPTPMTAFLSVVSKMAGFAVVIRFLYLLMPDLAGWGSVLSALAVLSMVIGNVVALGQTNIKRLLAYSTIAHVGYMLLGLVVLTPAGIASLLYYLIAYFFMNLGTFALVIHISNRTGSDEIASYAGLVQRKPTVVLALTLFLLSLAGIPVTSGFFGKFFLFQAVAQAGHNHLWLVVIALLTSTISLYYYLNIIRLMMIKDPSPEVTQLKSEPDSLKSSMVLNPVALTVAICVLATMWLGFMAEGGIGLTTMAVDQMRVPVQGVLAQLHP